MIKYLLGKATTGKFRWWQCECDEEWHDDVKGYVIQRSYGQVGGKTTMSPICKLSQIALASLMEISLKLPFCTII